MVVVGGGFGGMEAAKRLKNCDVDVTVVDRHNHLLFQPLIYQVAAGALAAGEVAAPQRHMLKRQANATVLMGAVTDIDAARRQVVLDRGERLDYDSLILACGGETSYFGHDEWQEVTCGLKTLSDAVDLRDRIFGAFEEAERTDDPTARDEWLTFVVVGGGPTGVEIAGQLAILSRHTMKRDFRRIDPRTARVILLDAGERVVAAFSEQTSAKAASALGGAGRHRPRARAGHQHRRARRDGQDRRPSRADRHPDSRLGGRRAHREHRGGVGARRRCKHRPGRAHRGEPRPDGARTP